MAGQDRQGRLIEVLDRRAGWVEAAIVLFTIASGFVVLGYLAGCFQDYSRS